MDFGFNRNGKLKQTKGHEYDDANLLEFGLVEFDGITYQLPCVMYFKKNADRGDVYRDIAKVLAQKYLEVVE